MSTRQYEPSAQTSGNMPRGRNRVEDEKKKDPKREKMIPKPDDDRGITILQWFTKIDDESSSVDMALIDGHTIKIVMATGIAPKQMAENSAWITVKSTPLVSFVIKIYGFTNSTIGKMHSKNLGHFFASRIQNKRNSWLDYQNGGYLTNCTNSGDSHFSLSGVIAPVDAEEWPEDMTLEEVPLGIMKVLLGSDGVVDGAVLTLPTTDATWSVSAPPVGGASGEWVLTLEELHSEQGA